MILVTFRTFTILNMLYSVKVPNIRYIFSELADVTGKMTQRSHCSYCRVVLHGTGQCSQYISTEPNDAGWCKEINKCE